MGIDNDIFGMTLCTSIRIHDNGATFRCQQSINGRYVTVVNRDGPVSICDFKIHGKLKKKWCYYELRLLWSIFNEMVVVRWTMQLEMYHFVSPWVD